MDNSTKRVVDRTREMEQLVPSPWDRTEFLTRLGEFRGREIRLVSMHSAVLQGLPCGIWLVFDDHDVILYDDSTSDYHVDQTVLHEVGHMILNHHGGGSADSSLGRLLPDMDIDLVRGVLSRQRFGDAQEFEAELFADMMMSSSVTRFRRSNPIANFWS